MGATRVVPVEPGADDLPGLREALKLMLPDTLFFETAKEALDDPVLLGSVGRDEFLLQPIIAARAAEAPALKDQAASIARSASFARPRKANSYPITSRS